MVTFFFNLECLFIEDYTLFSGNLCFIMLYGIHRHHVWGHDAAQFRPERWLDGSLPDNANAFAAFSIGRRGCIGELLRNNRKKKMYNIYLFIMFRQVKADKVAYH